MIFRASRTDNEDTVLSDTQNTSPYSWVAQELQILCFNCYSKNFEHHTLLSKLMFGLERLRLKLFNTLTNANTHNLLAVLMFKLTLKILIVSVMQSQKTDLKQLSLILNYLNIALPSWHGFLLLISQLVFGSLISSLLNPCKWSL